MIYAAGLTYLLMAFLFLVVGIPVYIWARKDAAEDERKAGKPVPPLFTKAEKIGVAVVVIVALVAIIAFASGKVSL